MFKFGVALAIGTVIYCWITGDVPVEGTHRAVYFSFGLSAWLMFEPCQTIHLEQWKEPSAPGRSTHG